MSDIEKRRTQLLQDTRKIYSDQYSPPASHPRYQSVYASLYDEGFDEKSSNIKLFFIRLFVAVLIFGAIFLLDYREEKIANVNSNMIIREIQKDLFGE